MTKPAASASPRITIPGGRKAAFSTDELIAEVADAAALCKIAGPGRPLGLCLSGSRQRNQSRGVAAKHINSQVAADADILFAPDLEAGNLVIKELNLLADSDAARILLGARVSITRTRRADNVRTRMASGAAAALYPQGRRGTAAVGKFAG